MDELLYVFVAIAIIIFAVPYVLACLLYTFPFFLVWLLVPGRTSADPLLVIDPSSHPLLAQLRAEKRNAENQYDEVRYSDVGIRWSDNLDRFEERSVRGRELNEQLEYWSSEVDRIKSEIDDTQGPEEIQIRAWRKALFARSKTEFQNSAKLAGLKWAALSFLAVWLAAELIGLIYPGFIGYFKFAWNPNPDLLHPALALGAAAGWAAGLYKSLKSSTSFSKQARAAIDQYENAKELREQAEDEAFELAQHKKFERQVDDDEDGDDEIQSEEQDTTETWYEALGVSSEATKDEIKTAYRTRIKQYHPDRVSGLGEKLQALAERETQKLNAAREEGLSLRM